MKLFITGISGLLGLNVGHQVSGRYTVSGCYFSSPIEVDGVHTMKLDVANFGESNRVLRAQRPDIILHTAGLTNVEECERNPRLAQRLNVRTSRNIARQAAHLGAKLVHISTDHLFDGTQPLLTETDTPAPLNVYGQTKWLAEQAVLEEYPNALIIRTNFFGWGTSKRASFSDWILDSLENQRPLTMFSDVFFTPILINQLADLIIALIERGAEGVVNVVGGERISKWEFALKAAKVFGYSTDGIRPVSVDNMSFTAHRPKDMSLSSEKVQSYLKVQMPTVLEGLERLKGLGLSGWAGALEKSVQGGASPAGPGEQLSGVTTGHGP